MTTTRIPQLFGALTTLCGFLVAGSASAALLNPSFETFTPSPVTADAATPVQFVSNFELRRIGSGQTTAEAVATDVTDGAQAVQLTVTGEYAAFISQFRTGADLAAAGLVDGETYTFEADVTINSSATVLESNTFIELQIFGSGASTLDVISDITADGTTVLPFVFNAGLNYNFNIRGGVYSGSDPLVLTTDNWRIVPEPALLPVLVLGVAALRRRRAAWQ